MKQIYLDNAATTQTDPRVLEEMLSLREELAGNASSLHKAGMRAATLIERARLALAAKINADPACIVFTSGGTESNNLALKGIALANRDRGDHLVVSRIEHPSVLEAARWLERQGFRVTHLEVDRDGFVDPAEIEKSITPRTILVSLMHANNEIGTVEPIAEAGRICRSRGVYFHTDACQSFTREPLDVERQRLDLVSLNAHKIHGPRGAGALYVRKGAALEPLLHGGGQENGLRSGTYNAEGIVGFARAAELASDGDSARMASLRDLFISLVEEKAGGRLNGPRKERLCNNASVRFDGADGKELFLALSRQGIMVSTGSACHAKKDTPSHVLLAAGFSPEEARSTIRVTLSRWTTKDEIERAAEAVAAVVRRK